MNVITKVLDALSTKIVRIHGSSMEPTQPDGALVVVNRRAFKSPRRPARFDIVRLEDPNRRGHWLIKRIVGLPGEEVLLESGSLFIDGQELAEPHLDAPGSQPAESDEKHEWWPNENEYVVLGDNRGASTDSRKFGAVPIGAIRGRVGRRLR